MSHIIKRHRYAASFDGLNPDISKDCIEADSLDALDELVEDHGYEPQNVDYYYQLKVDATTSWGRIDDTTNYEVLLSKLTRDFRNLGREVLADTPITQVHIPNYSGSRAREAQEDWESDYNEE